jgi:L-ribulose-5-phosphate 3-epimerase
MDQNRRDFIKSASAFAAASMLPKTMGFNGAICLFSKHLPAMDWARLAQAVKKLGFGGVDLTVRPGGHVAARTRDRRFAEGRRRHSRRRS